MQNQQASSTLTSTKLKCAKTLKKTRTAHSARTATTPTARNNSSSMRAQMTLIVLLHKVQRSLLPSRVSKPNHHLTGSSSTFLKITTGRRSQHQRRATSTTRAVQLFLTGRKKFRSTMICLWMRVRGKAVLSQPNYNRILRSS